MNPPRSLRPLVHAPALFAALLMVSDVVARVFAPGYTGVSAMWFLPMCFLFVAQTQLVLIARIEALEAQAKQAQAE
jgi:hypothetical protein